MLVLSSILFIMRSIVFARQTASSLEGGPRRVALRHWINKKRATPLILPSRGEAKTLMQIPTYSLTSVISSTKCFAPEYLSMTHKT